MASSALNFTKAIKGRGYNKYKIRSWFKKLVDVDDYCQADIREIIDWLMLVTAPIPPRGGEKKE